jgi:flagellar biosynthesis chaperone FliJ
MNKERRKNLQSVMALIEDAKEQLELLAEEEEEYIENMPENLQGSGRCERAEEALEYMQEAINYIEDAVDNINSAIEA